MHLLFDASRIDKRMKQGIPRDDACYEKDLFSPDQG